MKDATFSSARLLALYECISDAEDAIPRLRRFVLDLAVRGKLVEQDAGDEPAAELLTRIAKTRILQLKERSVKKAVKLNELDPVEVPFEVPINWEWVRLNELTELVYGKLLPTSALLDEGYEVFGANGIIGRYSKYLYENPMLLISCRGAYSGTPNISRAKCFVTNNSIVCELFDPSCFNIRYLHSFLSVSSRQSIVTGTAQPQVTITNAIKLPVALPPIAEQHRIVAKVDELMALCDQLEQARAGREAVRTRLTTASLNRLTAPETDAQALPAEVGTGFASGNATNTSTFQSHARFALQSLPTLTTRPDQIKTLRQTILNLAVRGKLVEQDTAEEPGEDLLGRIRHKKNADVGSVEAKRSEKFSASEEDLPFKLPKNWSVAALRELSYNLGDGLHGTPEYINVGDIYFINGTNLRDGRIEVFPNTKKVSENELAKHAKPLNHRTLLVSINGTLTNYAFYRGERVVLGKSACYFEISPLVEMQFIRVLVQSPYYIDYAFEKATGATISNLSLKAMNNLPIPLPPLAEQHRIVAKVDALMTLCDQLEASLTTAATTRSKLLRALLHEALEPAAETADA